jgi:hypothetical protein
VRAAASPPPAKLRAAKLGAPKRSRVAPRPRRRPAEPGLAPPVARPAPARFRLERRFGIAAAPVRVPQVQAATLVPTASTFDAPDPQGRSQHWVVDLVGLSLLGLVGLSLLGLAVPLLAIPSRGRGSGLWGALARQRNEIAFTSFAVLTTTLVAYAFVLLSSGSP